MDVDSPPPAASATAASIQLLPHLISGNAVTRVAAPPSVILSTSDSPACAKVKLDELFVKYLSTNESKSFLLALLEDAKSGKDFPPQTSFPAAPPNSTISPGSPVSRLIRSHSPFAETSPRSANSFPSTNARNLSPSKLVNELDLGSSNLSFPANSLDAQPSNPTVSSSNSPNVKTESATSVPENNSKSEDIIMHPAEGRTLPNGLLDAMHTTKREPTSISPIKSEKASEEMKSSEPVVRRADSCKKMIDKDGHHSTSRDHPPDTKSGTGAYMADARPGGIPRFFYPCGRDAEARERRERESISEFFQAQRKNNRVDGATKNDIGEFVVEVVGVPSYFASLIYARISEWYPCNGESVPSNGADGNDATMKDTANAVPSMADANLGTENGVSDSNGRVGMEFIREEQFVAYYNSECAGRSKEERLFKAILDPASNRDYLIPADFKALLRALLTCHQGLAFLHATPEFQHRYSETVIERIYFGCTRKHNGRLTLADIKRSKLLDTLIVVDEEEDINRERKYFSYEHFYVLYCRFWELDTNHDLQINREDLMRYGGHSLTFRIVDRIFGGHARPLDGAERPGMMSYTDFIWFCLSEEDKTSETAIDYWFRCVDLDGDGLITMFDMEFFYQEQLHRMECFGHEPVAIRDILCQLLDMVKPNVVPPIIRRRDLKKCRLSGNFFNILFNLNKFFALETRDPLLIRQEQATPELTDWDRFAAIEYLRLSAEEEGDEDEGWEDVAENAAPLMAGEAPF